MTNTTTKPATHRFRLCFTNPGEIDIRGALIAGLSAKTTTSAIGEFGTGLKYAIASILRWGGQITIYSGTSRHTFTTAPILFRDREHSVILHNDAETGFTTHYGAKWEPWQVYRELYSNMLDEDGEVWEGDESLATIEPGRTNILIRCDALRAPHHERNDIFLPANSQPLLASKTMEILDKPSSQLYYKRVRVHTVPCAFTYNALSTIDLTEDRTLKYTWNYHSRIAALVQTSSDPEFCFRWLQAASAENGFESACRSDLSTYADTSLAFRDTACQLFSKNRKRFGFLKALVNEWKPELVEEPAIALTPMQQRMLDKASALVSRMGVGDCAEASISVRDLGPQVLGQYNKATDAISLSPELFRQGTKQLVSCLFEEMVHRHTGKEDCNYDMQTYLFNTIVSLYEEHVFGEPI